MRKLLIFLALVAMLVSSKVLVAEGCNEGNCVNGYGTYVYSNGARYVGQWENDRKHGRGELYSMYGKLLYSGQYKAGKYHGRGKSYYKNGKLLYSGQWKKGKKHGIGKEYDEKGKLIYSGKYGRGRRVK